MRRARLSSWTDSNSVPGALSRTGRVRLQPFDFVTIIEAADNETVAHLSVDLGSRGTVNILTLPAIPTADLKTKLKEPKQIGRS